MGLVLTSTQAQDSTPRSPSDLLSHYSIAVSGLDNPYQTVLSSWASQEEVDSESSNEEEDASVQPEGAVDPSNTNT